MGRGAHGPRPIDIDRTGGDVTVTRSLAWLTAHDRKGFEPSLGRRPAAAFNLAILTSMIGTPWLPDLTDHVLMIEEVSEPLYRIDRMLFQLAHARSEEHTSELQSLMRNSYAVFCLKTKQ